MKNLMFIWIFLSLFSGSASAAMISQIWTTTVYGQEGNFAENHVNKEINFYITYDDASYKMNSYRDGANTIGEFGSGDDSVFRTYCTGPLTGTDGCNNTFVSYKSLSNATVDFSELSALYEITDEVPGDYHPINYSWILTNSLDQLFLDVGINGFSIRFRTDWVGFQSQEYFYTNSAGGISIATIDLRDVVVRDVTNSSTVSLPASIWLFGSVLLGMTGFRKFKKA